MGKKQHQKDKLYLTTREWKEIGGHKGKFIMLYSFYFHFLDNEDTKIQRATFKRLPFTHCALTFLPFTEPVCTPQGEIFDKK
jgi:peptidyl-prolyl cis-trans isomerase-like protein 2